MNNNPINNLIYIINKLCKLIENNNILLLSTISMIKHIIKLLNELKNSFYLISIINFDNKKYEIKNNLEIIKSQINKYFILYKIESQDFSNEDDYYFYLSEDIKINITELGIYQINKINEDIIMCINLLIKIKHPDYEKIPNTINFINNKFIDLESIKKSSIDDEIIKKQNYYVIKNINLDYKKSFIKI